MSVNRGGEWQVQRLQAELGGAEGSLLEEVGRSWRQVLTPGYFDRVAFLQTLCVRISASPPHPHMSPRLLKSPSAESTPPYDAKCLTGI